MEHDITPSNKGQIESLKERYEILNNELHIAEEQAVRLKDLSNKIYNEIEDNKKLKNSIEISLQRIAENIQQLNLS